MPDNKKTNLIDLVMTEEEFLKDDSKIILILPGTIRSKKNSRQKHYAKTKTGKLIQFSAASGSYRAWEQRARQATQDQMNISGIIYPMICKFKLEVKAFMAGNLMDLDAVHTAVMDALEGIVWKNDKQIAQFSDQSCVVKESAYPRTEVIIERLEA